MKNIIIAAFGFLLSINVYAQSNKAVTTRGKNYRETTVSTEIDASLEKIWKLLTDASSYTRWNSTIISLDGTIALGNKIKLVSKLDPSRTFKLKVKTFEPNEKMIWGDKKGNRIYTLTRLANGKTLFTMTERIGGFMFNMYADKIPSFNESFEQFAKDLKAVAEKD